MKKVLIGCALVIAFGLVAAIVVSVVSYSWWQRNAPDTAELESIRADLETVYGDPDRYHPPLDGSLDRARVDAYVRVREAIVPERDRIGEHVSGFLLDVAGQEDMGGGFLRELRSGLSLAKRGVNLYADGIDFVTLRAETLREAGMGEGEYAYLDALALYSWLKLDVYAIAESDPVAADVRDIREGVEEALDVRRDLMIDQLRRARREISRLEGPSAAERAFGERIEAALEHARSGPEAFPFQDDMPARWLEVLAPYETRVRATLPRSAGEVLLEGAEELMSDDGGFQINVGNE